MNHGSSNTTIFRFVSFFLSLNAKVSTVADLSLKHRPHLRDDRRVLRGDVLILRGVEVEGRAVVRVRVELGEPRGPPRHGR